MRVAVTAQAGAVGADIGDGADGCRIVKDYGNGGAGGVDREGRRHGGGRGWVAGGCGGGGGGSGDRGVVGLEQGAYGQLSVPVVLCKMGHGWRARRSKGYSKGHDALGQGPTTRPWLLGCRQATHSAAAFAYLGKEVSFISRFLFMLFSSLFSFFDDFRAKTFRFWWCY